MPNIINNWPYTDLHNLNLDWIINKIKDLQEQVTEFTQDLPHVSAWNNGTWDQTHAYDANEIVFDDNKMYLSLRSVPAGVLISNTSYWTEIADMGFDPSAIIAAITALQGDVQDIQDTLFYVTPEEYGAVRDGSTDCSAAFAAAMNSGKTVKLLTGANGYVIKNPVIVTARSARLTGPDANWTSESGASAGITLTDNGYFMCNNEYTQFENVYFYSYNRTAGSKSAITVNGPDNLNGDAEVKNCIFSSVNDSIICNARGLYVDHCLFARGTPAITLNYIGTTNNPTPIQDSTITGGRGFVITNCRFHTGATWAVEIPASATAYNFNFENNLADHEAGEIVVYGSLTNGLIDGNTWTMCTRPVLAVAGGKMLNSVFSNNVCSSAAANGLADNFIAITGTGNDTEIDDLIISGNTFKTSAYRAIHVTQTKTFDRVLINDNTFDDLNITGDDITYGAISLPGTFNAVIITGNVFGQVAPTAAGCCIRSAAEDNTGTLNMLVVQNNIKTYDKDYLVHTYLQGAAVNSDLQTYRMDPTP